MWRWSDAGWVPAALLSPDRMWVWSGLEWFRLPALAEVPRELWAGWRSALPSSRCTQSDLTARGLGLAAVGISLGSSAFLALLLLA